MRPARAVATAAAATALVGAAAATAAAGPSGGVNPPWARPGQTVWLSDSGRCEPGRGATAHSGAFGTVRLKPGRPGGGELAGGAKVFWHARGKYEVTIRCGDGKRLVDWLKVGATKGSHTGEGGAFAGMNTVELGGGAALVALALGGGAVALRRRMREAR